MLPGVLAVTAQGADVDILGEIQFVESFGEQLDCIVDKRSLSLSGNGAIEANNPFLLPLPLLWSNSIWKNPENEVN